MAASIFVLFSVVVFLILNMHHGFMVNMCPRIRKSNKSLRMSTPEDPMAAIRAKMAANPNYNPMTDPEAAGSLEAMIPTEYRDVLNALERFRVALVDADQGPESLKAIDDAARSMNINEIISSPTSKWIKDGRPKPDVPFSESTAAGLVEKVKAEFPQVPYGN